VNVSLQYFNILIAMAKNLSSADRAVFIPSAVPTQLTLLYITCNETVVVCDIVPETPVTTT
jgi:hypothetical protein